jgi:hypothetical protein
MDLVLGLRLSEGLDVGTLRDTLCFLLGLEIMYNTPCTIRDRGLFLVLRCGQPLRALSVWLGSELALAAPGIL